MISTLSRCTKLGTKMFFGFALAALALCPKASAQQLSSCDKTGGVQPCIQKFVDPLPIPPLFQSTLAVVNGNPADYYEIAARQFAEPMLSCSNAALSPNCTAALPITYVWGYGQNNSPGHYDPLAQTQVCDLGSGNTTFTNCFSSPSPTIAVAVKRTVQVKWINDLVCHAGDAGCAVGAAFTYTAGVKPSFTNHWANPTRVCNNTRSLVTDCQGTGGYTGPVPLTVHAHGEISPSESDGLPESWNLPASGFNAAVYFPHGSDYCQSDANGNRSCTYTPGSATFTYPNRQFGTTLFFHDHALGVTTENVYMGLAGFYLIGGTNTNLSGVNSFNFSHEEPSDCGPAGTPCAYGGVSVPGGLPEGDCFSADIATTNPQTQDSGCFELGVAITDKAFNTDGSLQFSENGNTIVVNGKTWPFLNVQPRKYRFRLVVAAPTSRFDLTFPIPNNNNENGAPPPTATITQIGADGGFLPHPAKLTKPLSLMPGERADVIIDFSQFWACAPPLGNGCSVDLLNNNGGGDTGTVMRFNIVQFPGCDPNNNIGACFPPTADTSCNLLGQLTCTSSDTLPHRTCADTQADCNNPPVRQVSLFDDHLGSCGAVNANTKCSGAGMTPLPWDGAVTETPTVASTEIWEMYDFMDSHPMHLHEAQFELINRENMQTHVKTPPGPGETGYKDTIQANGGQITRVRVIFQGPKGPSSDPAPEQHPGLFAWHCHINPHEDNEMMRPMCVQYPKNDPNPQHQAANAACLASL